MAQAEPLGAASGDVRRAGGLVRDARSRAGISQRELARRSGVPGPVVNAIERGKRQPSVPTLAKVLRGLGLDLHLVAVPPGAPVDGRPGGWWPAASARAVSIRSVSDAERLRAREIRNALDLANRIVRAKRRERARGVR